LDIGVDVDGCFHEFVGELTDWVHLSTGRPLDTLPYATTWEFYKDQWGMTTAEFLDVYSKGVKAGYIFRTRAADPTGVAALTRLASAGHRLHIVTARRVKGAEAEAEAATRWWLDQHQVPYTTLNVVASDKAPTALELGIDVAIDDATHHYDELDEAGCVPYLMTRPWNQHHRGRRVYSWDGFAAAVSAMART
jgi:uncharacterized HAD superfamily protein